MNCLFAYHLVSYNLKQQLSSEDKHHKQIFCRFIQNPGQIIQKTLFLFVASGRNVRLDL